MMHLCLRLLSPVSSCRAETGLEPAAVPSALDREAAMRDSLAFELHQAAEAQETLCVAVAVAGLEHADAVDDRGDRGACAAAEVLAEGADAQVVVAAPAAGTSAAARRP